MSTSRHPKGLYLIFATSTAERFSYYGMRAIFILFLTQALRELSHWLMYGGLTFLILGNGCFKPTVSSLVGQLYEPGDKRLDSA